MKKFLSLFLSFTLALSISIPVFASEPTRSTTTEAFSVSAALSTPEIVNFLNKTGEMDELVSIQNELKTSLYENAAKYVQSTFTISENPSDITANDIQQLSDKYNLNLPAENAMGMIDNGTINVTRNTYGNIVDVWYLYYPYNDSYFSACAAMVDKDNPLDSISGSVNRYYLNGSSWKFKDTSSFKKEAVRNGEFYRWSIPKWGVKEKIEYNITVVDNLLSHNFTNANENNFIRYNFAAGPYNTLTAQGGQRHHFVAATSLRNSGFDSKKAYCIRMISTDHYKTASYGNSAYVSSITALLKEKKYKEALQKEVDNFKAVPDPEGIQTSLQTKYYDEVVTCLYHYELLFGLR